ncbi:MAG: AIR carboxylase family protein [Candidatus Bathyarchaeia archaeon]
MAQGKIVVFMGSKHDYEFASRVGRFLQDEGFGVECEYVVASAHKTPRKLLDEMENYEKAGGQMVFITVAGLSDALSGTVAGASRYPVIACPPDSEKFGYAKFFSSAMTPQGVAVAYVPRPENAALSAVKVLALSDKELQRRVKAYMRRLKEGVKA